MTTRNILLRGEDFYILDQPSEIRTLGITRPQGGTPQSVTLIAESGYLMLAKSLTDDLSWDVQRKLVNDYFTAADIALVTGQTEEEVNKFVESNEDELLKMGAIVEVSSPFFN